MRKITIFIILITNFSIVTFAQEPQELWNWEFEMTIFDSIIHKKIYRVSIENNQQVEIIRFNNGEYKGHLNNVIWTTNKKQERLKRISQVIKIPDTICKKLFISIENLGFEKIPDSWVIEGATNGLDGETTFFSTETNSENRTVSFWELMNDYYYKDNIPNEIKKAQAIVDIINNEFNLKDEFEKFTLRLPFGKYIYSSLIMIKKKKNVW